MSVQRARSAFVIAAAGLLPLGASACEKGTTAPSPGPSAPPATAGAPAAPPQGGSIGSATMEADGTIVLMLRAEDDAGTVGEALLRYPRGDKDYDTVLKHLGGLKPGESKSVPPWP